MGTPREKAYDKKISPLMSQIIAICKKHQIPMVAQFALDDQGDGNGPLRCTTVILDEEWSPPSNMKKASQILYHGEPAEFVAITVHSEE